MQLPASLRFLFQGRFPLILLGFLILNFILKLLFLDQVQIGMDEPFSIFYAQMPLDRIVKELSGGNNPPLFELLLHFWMSLFGDSVLSVRFLSLLATCLSALLMYLLGREIGWKWEGALAAVMFSFSRPVVNFSQEARVYALWTFLLLLVLYLLLRWLRTDNRVDFSALLVATILLLYSHYLSFVALAVILAWLMLFSQQACKSRIKTLLIGFAIVLLAYLPQISLMWAPLATAAREHWVTLSSFNELYSILSKYNNQPVVTVAALAILALAAGRFLWRHSLRDIPAKVWLLLGFFPGAFLLLFLLGFWIPVFLDRYLVFVMPAFFLLLARASWSLLPEKLGPVLSVAVAGAMVLTTQLAPPTNSQWREVADYVRQHQSPGTAVLLSPKWTYRAFSYHYQREWFRDWDRTVKHLHQQHIYPVLRDDRIQRLPALRQADHILLIVNGDFKTELHPSLQALLKDDFVETSTNEAFHGIVIRHMARRAGH